MDRFHFLDLLPISLALVASGTWFALSWGSPPKPPPDSLAHARELHRLAPLIDGHNDLPWQFREKANRDLSKIDIRKAQSELHTDIRWRRAIRRRLRSRLHHMTSSGFFAQERLHR